MGMFSNIYTNVGIYKQVITISEVDVQSMDLGNPYPLILTNNKFLCIPIHCHIYTINQTIPYTGFNHLHLVNTGTSQTNAIISENATSGGISFNFIFTFAMNIQQGGLFNGYQNNKNLSIGWDIPPTSGDGDMVVTLFYTKNNLF
jgi:hypothetical protein